MYQIDPLSRTPVYEQIIEQTKRFILSGVLTPGCQMASVRSIALTHSINPRTILKAYNDLDCAGMIKAVPGKGYYVCNAAKEILQRENYEKLNDLSDLFKQMKMAGVEMEELIARVREAYGDTTETERRRT